MTARIAVIVEGATEKAFKEPLINYLNGHLSGRMPRLKFISENGQIPTGDKLMRDVQRLLEMDNDAVIALTDVYTGSKPPEFVDAADARAKMRQWVGPEPRFHPHAAQYEFEAWLLPYWSTIQRLAGSDRRPLAAHPETVDHETSPATLLAQVFRAGSKKRTYSKTRGGAAILRDQDLAESAARCPQLQAFLDTVLELAKNSPSP